MAKGGRQESSDAAKDKRKGSSHKKPQKYDTSFKKWISQQVHEILPVLVEGVEYERELGVEVSRSMMRADKVFPRLKS